MADRSVQLNLSPTGTGADAVVVDGQNLSGAVRRVLLTSQVGEPPTLVLELAPRAFVVDAEGAQVGVSPVGEHILTQLGWRPPGAHPDEEMVWLGDLSGFQLDYDGDELFLRHRCGWTYPVDHPIRAYLGNLVSGPVADHGRAGCSG